MIKLNILISTIVLLVGVSCNLRSKKQISKPNIVFILADDLGYSDLGCMGSSFYETPNIDELANLGVRFTNGYAACQVCSPSRASIMTGQFPARHGITDWIGAGTGEVWRKAKRYTKMLPPDYVHHLPKESTTIAEALRNEAGYKTFFAGKWHLGSEGNYPEHHGFDVNQGGYEKGGPYSGGYFSPFNNPKMEDHPEEKGISLSVKLGNETAQFINDNKNEPFFAFLSFYAVHSPIQTSEKKWQHYRDKIEKIGIQDTGFTMERRLPIRKYQDNPIYAGLVEQMDEGVGVVLNTLKALNLLDNTIVIFTSDNGGVASGDNYSTSNYPLRGGKGYQWEGGIRIPYIIKWPGVNQGVSAVPVSGVDFFPTLLSAAGVELSKEHLIDGKNLQNIFKGEELPERSLIWHYPHYGNQGGDPSSIIINNNNKLIYYHESEQIELYDLSQDIAEQEDLYLKKRDVAEKMYDELVHYLTNVNARFPSPDPHFNADSLALKQHYYKTDLKDRLEKQRKLYYNKGWKPNDDWWGSTID